MRHEESFCPGHDVDSCRAFDRGRRRLGFTLIELLVVISVLLLLTGMLYPMLATVREKAATTDTTALMAVVDVALDLYAGEVGAYPYLEHAMASSLAGAPNLLASRLMVDFDDFTDADQDKLFADLGVARAAYMTGGSHQIALDGGNVAGVTAVVSGLLNRLATQRVVTAVLSGVPVVKGVHESASLNVVTLTSSGISYDFLSADLSADDVSGGDIIDSWGQAIFYNCPVVQGANALDPNILSWTNEFPGRIDPADFNMQTTGRQETVLLSDDQRTHAGADYCLSFEMWSAGPDQDIVGIRAAIENEDNLSLRPYNRDLQ